MRDHRDHDHGHSAHVRNINPHHNTHYAHEYNHGKVTSVTFTSAEMSMVTAALQSSTATVHSTSYAFFTAAAQRGSLEDPWQPRIILVGTIEAAFGGVATFR